MSSRPAPLPPCVPLPLRPLTSTHCRIRAHPPPARWAPASTPIPHLHPHPSPNVLPRPARPLTSTHCRAKAHTPFWLAGPLSLRFPHVPLPPPTGPSPPRTAARRRTCTPVHQAPPLPPPPPPSASHLHALPRVGAHALQLAGLLISVHEGAGHDAGNVEQREAGGGAGLQGKGGKGEGGAVLSRCSQRGGSSRWQRRTGSGRRRRRPAGEGGKVGGGAGWVGPY